ncbi:hypothetical protein GCM10011583_69350 [Streptomyces camponoticapitis]|uniref:FHA domain-containing protein n=1 Tax=Streptomyces camponoticapitis TaxID=1616125 RepID=A0ABQ2EVG2_9ACTN|nr:hypothetical protein [Streptomyces camponoticapitis]GGK27463.1 hypothetical protein GCM10011583_69350 [Streptomyces camponoticapitis]
MTLSPPRLPSKVNILPQDYGSLSRGIPPTQPGTLFVMGVNGGMSMAPDAAFPLVFGRNEPEVHVCVAPDDTRVSRKHGYIAREHSRWVLNNTGRLPIRLPGARLVLGGDRVELPSGFTPLFIVARKREHLLEVHIATATHGAGDDGLREADTHESDVWELSATEKLVLVCLAQRYLRDDPIPQPLPWADVAAELAELRPAETWAKGRAARVVAGVRTRLSYVVPGLMEDEVPQPVGNALNHNLITELLVTTTIVKSDLALLESDVSDYEPA